MSKLMIEAFKGTNTTIPVWFMRQAGRYLPAYQKLRSQYDLGTMFKDPSLATDISCLPLDVMAVDGVIIFADILSLPSEMGANIRFDNKAGPVVAMPDVNSMHDYEGCQHVMTTIQKVKARLPEAVTLIGFAGAPFTVLTYLVEGGSTTQFSRTYRFMAEQSEQFHALMRLLTKNTIDYLKAQIKHGVEMVQLFDTWIGVLPDSIFRQAVLPYLKEIFAAVDAPSIYFSRNSRHLWPTMLEVGADGFSLDHTFTLADASINQADVLVQGNFYNGLLYAKKVERDEHLLQLLNQSKNYSRYICNLSHGVFPDVDPSVLKDIVDQIHDFKIER